MKQSLVRAFSSAVCLIISGICFTALAYGKGADTNDMKTIEGSVWYRERMVLPPNAEIQIFLEDVARMDVPSDVIATTSFAPQGGPALDLCPCIRSPETPRQGPLCAAREN